jgi:hypothetical protein
MTGVLANPEAVREGFLGELTDSALEVAARHGVRGSSVDRELELWKVFGLVIRRRGDKRLSLAQPVRPRALGESLVAELTDAAYRVTLDHGFRGSFLDVQLDLWKALCRTTRTSRLAHKLFGALEPRKGIC